MVNDYLKKFEFNYESSATGSFLVVSTDAGENVLLYQVEMLASNPNKNILPLDIRQKDAKYNFTTILLQTGFIPISQTQQAKKE